MSTPDAPNRAPRGPLVRWLVANSTFGVPQAAGPIAYALLAIQLTGDAADGAALVLAITLAQVVGAVPIARLGRRWNAVSFVKALVVMRGVALAALAALAAAGAPFAWLIGAASLAGLVNGAAFGILRAVLNYLVEPSRMPRALGMAATLSEFTFVAAPVLASAVGTLDPVLAAAALSVLGTAPALLLPAIPHARTPVPADGGGSLLKPQVLLWLGCMMAGSSVVSAIEIGAVSLALDYGFSPAMGFIFAVALCIASVAGGIWVSVRNRMAQRSTVLLHLALMSAGAVLIALHLSVAATLLGAVIVGCFLAPLGTAYSLMLDALAPPHRRAELFALARTVHSFGIILTSANLTLTSLAVTQAVATALILAATAAVGISLLAGRASRPRSSPPA